MIVNFEIENHHALIYRGSHIDIHNNFDFSGFSYEPDNRQLNLTFIKSNGDWVKNDKYKTLTLVHTNVFFFKIVYDNKERNFTADDKCVSDITFFPSNDREVNDRITMQGKPDEDDDIIYMFQSDYFIRVGCNKIELLITE